MGYSPHCQEKSGYWVDLGCNKFLGMNKKWRKKYKRLRHFFKIFDCLLYNLEGDVIIFGARTRRSLRTSGHPALRPAAIGHIAAAQKLDIIGNYLSRILFVSIAIIPAAGLDTPFNIDLLSL